MFKVVFFFWRQSEGGTNAGWCISEGNQSHLLEKGHCRQKKKALVQVKRNCVARKKKHWFKWVVFAHHEEVLLPLTPPFLPPNVH